MSQNMKKQLMDHRLSICETDESQGLKTGFASLDKCLGGLKNGHLIICGARPSMGKSELAVAIADVLSIRDDKTCVLFSMGNSLETIVNRITRRHRGAVYSESELSLVIDDSEFIGIKDIEDRCHNVSIQEHIDLIIVDHLQMISTYNDSKESRKRVIKRLKSMALELHCPVLVLSQLKRSADTRDGNHPSLTDFRSYKLIEKYADTIMLLEREYYYNKYADPDIVNVILSNKGEKTSTKVQLSMPITAEEPLSQNENKDLSDDGWDDYENEFKEICLSCFRGDGKYNIGNGLAYLEEYKSAHIFSNDDDRMLFSRMINLFFRDLMYPLELHDDDWINNADRIGELLLFSERCLGEMKKLIRGHKSETSYWEDSDKDLLWQNLNVFLLTFYRYSEQWDPFYKRMDMICKDTENNIQYLLLHDQPNDLYKLEYLGKDDGFYTRGMEYWTEPLSWVYHEAASGRYAHRILNHYEEHLHTVFNMKKASFEAALILGQIHGLLQKRFERLKQLAEEELSDEENQECLCESRYYEEMLQEHKKTICSEE